MTETRPPASAPNFSYHWLHAERASGASIAQWCDGRWVCIGEPGFLTPAGMASRGWEYLGPVTRRPKSAYLDD